MIFLCYPKCTTCQKAKKWLDDHQIAYDLRDIKLDNPTAEELTAWHERSGLPLKKFFNTSGLLYKSMALKDKLPGMSEEEMIKLLATDGMLVKRPCWLARTSCWWDLRKGSGGRCWRWSDRRGGTPFIGNLKKKRGRQTFRGLSGAAYIMPF